MLVFENFTDNLIMSFHSYLFHTNNLTDKLQAVYKGLSIYYVSSYNKAGSFRMLTNAYLREQGFIQKLMSYENPH